MNTTSNKSMWATLARAIVFAAAIGLLGIPATLVPAGAVEYVLQISVDGMGSSYLQSLFDAPSQVPNFNRLVTEGASTFNARTDYDVTETLQNHTTMVTARGMNGTTGHNWTYNGDPAVGQTIHSNKGSYVFSVFDVSHDNGLRTGMYANKTKFSLFDNTSTYPGGGSYNATYGAEDTILPDNGRDKVDNTYINTGLTGQIVTALVAQQTGDSPNNYSFVHFNNPDSAGHSFGWGSPTYLNSIITVDGFLGQIFDVIDNPSSPLHGNTAVILSADHGGTGGGHGDPSIPLNYTIPFMVWGPGVAAGADLYALNPTTRLDPGTGRPPFSDPVQPIRHADGSNLALELLRLGAVPGSTINTLQDHLAVPEPSTIVLLIAGVLGLAVMAFRRRK